MKTIEFKTFEEYIKENEGVPAGCTTLGSIPGAGNPTPPTDTTVGSGDTFAAVGNVSTQSPKKVRKGKAKKKKPTKSKKFKSYSDFISKITPLQG